MDLHLTDERNHLVFISLLKAHGIRKVVASPGTTNMRLIASMQQDSFFEIYSSVDERSAAYLACGLSVESDEPVMLSCTGATASRNYMSGLTEAYYSKIPILAVTSSKDVARIGQNDPQLIDRRTIPNDIARISVTVPIFHTAKEEKDYTLVINNALLELKRNGGGPVHINLVTSYSRNYTEKSLPSVNVVRRICASDIFPELPQGKIAIYVRSHRKFDSDLVHAIEVFCEKNNAVVLVDHTSNYHGKYSVYSNIVTYQKKYMPDCCKMDLLIYIGNIDGSDFRHITAKQVWRVNVDGEIRDAFGRLTYTFAMDEKAFFKEYSKSQTKVKNSYFEVWNEECNRLRAKMPELPFSNIWIAQQTISNLPDNCCIHFGIQNSIRSWNFFEGKKTVDGYCNTGGFGIDGSLSSLIGASLCDSSKLYFGVLGDLSFFYDLNVLGNRHIKNNVRLLVINNGTGQQFKNPGSAGALLGPEVDAYVAATGHFGNKSRDLVKHFAQNLGFLYLSAENKEEYLSHLTTFVSESMLEQSVIFEVFTESEEEGEAMDTIKNLEKSSSYMLSSRTKEIIKKAIGEKTISKVRKFIKK